MVNDNVYCKLNGELEKSLSLLNKIKDEKLSIYRRILSNTARYNRGEIAYEEAINTNKNLLDNVDKLDYEQDVAEDRRSSAVLKRIKNNDVKSKKFFNRKIDGIDIRTFRELTIQLYDKILPQVCSVCGSRENLTIHHLRYKYPLELKDMVRMCRSCHSKYHQKLIKLSKAQTP